MPMVSPDKVELMAALGTGTMGGGWTAAFVAQGIKVNVWDPAEDTEPRIRAYVENAFPLLDRLGLVADGADPGNLAFFDDPAEACKGVQMVQESAPEAIQLKRDLYDAIDDALDPDAVLATSTSFYRPSMFQPDMKTPERLVVGHPFCPPHLIPLVEVVGGEQTPVETVDWTCAFYTAIGKKVIRLKKEIAGFVSNRLQSAIFREYAFLIDEGIVSVEDADTAVAYGPGLRWAFMGPTMTSHVSSPRGIEDAMQKYEVPPEILQERDGQDKWSAELSAAVVKAAATMSRNRPVDELWRQRDETLVSLLEVLKKHDW
jgi:carnitine 3-dehydrogenase